MSESSEPYRPLHFCGIDLRPIVADMGIININPSNATRTSEEGNNDTTSLEKDIITIVHAEFGVE
jgi:hypothetical protein